MQMLLLNARKQAHLPPQECPFKKAAGKAGSMCLPRACIWLTNQPANWLRTVGFVDCVTSRLFWEASGKLTAKTTSTDGLLLLLLACACQYELDSATCMKLFLFNLPQPFQDMMLRQDPLRISNGHAVSVGMLLKCGSCSIGLWKSALGICMTQSLC